MIIPLKVRNKKIFDKKQCAFPGCNNKFFGGHVSKYCPQHRSQKCYNIINQLKNPKNTLHEIQVNHKIIEHSFIDSQQVWTICKCCGKLFGYKLLTRRHIYPKYCPEHRNEHKRNMYYKLKGN